MSDSRARSGLSVLELLVSMSLMASLLMWLTSSFIRTEQERRAVEEVDLARRALQEEVARLKQLPFQELLRQAAGRWPRVTTTFDVAGLEWAAPQGVVHYVTDETLTDAQLRLSIGMPRDLDGDGRADNRNTTVRATMMPMVAEVAWSGVRGPGSLRTVFLRHEARQSQH